MMKSIRDIGILWSLVVVIAGWEVHGQEPITKLKITGDEIVVEIDRSGAGNLLDSITRTFGLDFKTIDSVWNDAGERNICGPEDWCVRKFTKTTLVLYKSMSELRGKINWLESPVIVDDDWIGFAVGPQWQQPVFGVNDFDKITVKRLEDGSTRFSLPDHDEASRVFLSGTFNNWSTLATPMKRTENGWHVALHLPPGKYWYKFIVDGRWMHDPYNNVREPDGHGGKNSIFYVYNYTFHLDTFQSAKRVYLAGSFNGWRPRSLRMNRTVSGWQLPMYLREGTHAYKFIVDRQWILDPSNPVTRPDGRGNVNSFMAVGDTFYFHLDQFPNANEVIVTGNFNGWNERELSMTKTDSGWVLPYVLAPGNYEYKFIVDGKWMTDPGNPHTIGTGDYMNSILVIEPNHTFRLEGFADASKVMLTGNFNSWNENGYTLKRENGIWLIKLNLEPGKYTYKYIVDGEWIMDPGNDLYEENEFGTGNSVIWIEPEAISSE